MSHGGSRRWSSAGNAAAASIRPAKSSPDTSPPAARGEAVLAELCRALYREDAGFHWFQSIDAAAAQHRAWPAGSPEAGLVLIGASRWLAAHTPTVRATDQVVTITRRLLRGEHVYEDQ